MFVKHLNFLRQTNIKQLETNQHKTAFQIIPESAAIEVSEVEERILVKEAFDLTQTLLCKSVDFQASNALR